MKTESTPQELRRFLTSMLVVSFVLNSLWEMAQMPAYREIALRPWRATASLCTRATIGDVAITLLIYATGALAARTLSWGLRPAWNVYSAAALLGAMHGFWIERAAIASGGWAYSQTMPVVPMLKVGLWPLLQLTVLTPLAFWLANRCWLAPRTHGT
jgi:hypothetical protein